MQDQGQVGLSTRENPLYIMDLGTLTIAAPLNSGNRRQETPSAWLLNVVKAQVDVINCEGEADIGGVFTDVRFWQISLQKALEGFLSR